MKLQDLFIIKSVRYQSQKFCVRNFFRLIMSSFAILTSVTNASASEVEQTQLDLNKTAVTLAREADKELNVAYARLEPNNDLKAAERAWIIFRDAECKYEAAVYAGGSLQAMTYSSCIKRLTLSRTKELTRLSKFDEYRRQ